MGFDDGRMVLDSPNGAYYSGQTIRGNLIFQQDSVKTFRGIFLKFRGYCKVHWTTTETRRVNDRQETYTKDHDSYEEYINVKVYLVGGESGEHHIQPGKYDYPFTFHLPANCPSSFEGEYGHVRYEIKAVVDRAFKFDQEKKVAIRVLAPLDLNLDPYCREPIEMDINDTYCCCCFSSGSTETVINAPMSGYCPGQKIPIEIACSNKGNVDIGHIKLRIVKKVEFIATHHPGRKSDKDVIAEIKKSSIPGNTTRNWTTDMEIPALDACNLSGCSYINIDYKFEVVVSPDGCHNDTEDSRKLIIGTIPLVGFQDNVVNPLHDQMPQQIAAVTQQPMSSYPTTSPYPYPGDNTPYPTNTPYSNNPNQNPPYSVTTPLLNTNAPYPSPNPPYPATNSPYPVGTPNAGTNPPYPTNDVTKPPYPTTNSPYPVGTPNTVTNPPYPTNDVTKSPYTATNSPYPIGLSNTTTNPPYPVGTPNMTTNPPYPAADETKSPYPPTNSPYPVGTPNISTNPPYHSQNSPYPDNPPPYPSNNSPYPAGQQNTPNPMGSMGGTGSNVFGGRLLKTGNIGFTVQGSNMGNMPFPGTATSVPISSVPVNPYMAASAPVLDSPDTEKKKENE